MSLHYHPHDTIAAVATPPGEGGVAIIRISGPEAIDVAQKIFSGNIQRYKTHTAHFGRICDLAGNFIDEVLLLLLRNPKSYTGEDTVEIQCHGGSIVTRKVLDAVIQAGARAAQPGEFTFKAFMNGKIDLAQAEAVQSLICAKNDLALNAAEHQLQGKLSEKILSFQRSLLDIAAILEAWVDFPEEGLEFASMEEVCTQIVEVMGEIEKLKETFHEGRKIHEGVSLCLVGCPNVGKSSLMNLLLGKERAIVTDIAGTTRDILEDDLLLNGLHFRLIDTAGIRETSEVIEREGIKRTEQALENADLILLVLDASRDLTEQDQILLAKVPVERTLLVWNKIDIVERDLKFIEGFAQVSISAKQGLGIEKLKESIDQILWNRGVPSKEEVVITQSRHKESLVRCVESLRAVLDGLWNDASPELITDDIKQALKELGKIIGLDLTEDVLSAIFSKFCIGK